MARSIATIGGQPVLSPDVALRNAREQNTPLDFWQRANSYTCPRGPEPGVAWLLMTRRSLDKLDPNEFHSLRWQDDKLAAVLEIPSLVLVRSYTLNHALSGDKDAARLVELRDRRHLFRMSSINAQYNVRHPAPSGTSGSDLYYDESLNGGSGDNFVATSGDNLAVAVSGTITDNLAASTGIPWTWQAMLDDVWANLPDTGTNQDVVGDPTLPYDPDGMPEGFRFIGENAWDALHVVLDKLGLTTAYDPVLDVVGPYVAKFETQDGLTGSINSSKYTGRLMFDYDPDEPSNEYIFGKFPETVRVFFPRLEQYRGIERDTTNSDNWELAPVESKDYATGLTGAHPDSIISVWDDLPALYDLTETNTNSGDLQARADEIGGNIKNTLMFDRSRRMYAGLLWDVLPGSEITELRWRDYGDARGLVTEILQRSELDEFLTGPSFGTVNEHLKPPDLSRHTHPLYPHLIQSVLVDDGLTATGDNVSPNASDVIPGFVRKFAGGVYTNLDPCWIRPVDLEQGGSPDPANVINLRQDDTLVGRLSGVVDHSGDVRPVYLVRAGEGGTGGTFSFTIEDERPSPQSITVDDGDTVKLDTTVDKVGLPTTWTEFRVDAGAPEDLQLAFGAMVQIRGFSTGIDGSETLFPTENLDFYGSYDEVGSGAGNIIDVQITKLGNTVEVRIDAQGTLFDIVDVQSPTPGTANVDIADTWTFITEIDETQTTMFAQYKISESGGDPETKMVFGKVFDVEDDASPTPGSVDIFPLERLQFAAGTGLTAAVTKATNTVTVTYAGTPSSPAPSGKMAVADAQIDAIDEATDTPGTATASVWEFDNGTVSDTLANVTAYNYFDYNIPSGERVLLLQEEGNSRYMAFGDGHIIVEGFSAGVDGQETLYPYETLLIQGDRDQSVAVGEIIDVQISKAGDTVTVDINATGDLFTIRDERSPQQTANIALASILQLDTVIDKLGLPATFAEFRAISGGALLDEIELAFGALIQVRGHSPGVDGQATLYVTENLDFTGDRDVSPVLGNIIDITVTDEGSTVDVNITATGDMFAIEGDTGTVNVALGETISMVSQIDEVQQANNFLQIQAVGNNVIWEFGKLCSIEDDQSPQNVETLFPLESIHFQTTPAGGVTVNKIGNEIDVTIDTSGAPVGTMWMSVKKPILSGGKYYMDDGTGTADTNWAWMDGSSNQNPGSGLEICSQGGDHFFVRGTDSRNIDAVNTRRGRTGGYTDQDEVRGRIEDHLDHIHTFDTDVCDEANCRTTEHTSDPEYYEFSVQTGIKTNIQKQPVTGNPIDLVHIITELDNSWQETTSPPDDEFRFDVAPPHKKVHFYERVA